MGINDWPVDLSLNAFVIHEPGRSATSTASTPTSIRTTDNTDQLPCAALSRPMSARYALPNASETIPHRKNAMRDGIPMKRFRMRRILPAVAWTRNCSNHAITQACAVRSLSGASLREKRVCSTTPSRCKRRATCGARHQRSRSTRRLSAPSDRDVPSES